MYVRRTLAAALAAVFASPSVAGPPEQPTVVVSASRRAETVDDTLATVTVLDRAAIEASQAPDLLELLRLQPGIDLARSGGPGQATTLFLRGTNSNQTLVLIDGVRVASANSGLFDLAHLPLDQIERIEIVRGPRASFWGSDAIGGVLQVFTRDPDGTAARLRAGRYGRLGGAVTWSAAGERGRLGLTIGGERLDGFSAQTPAGFAYDPDDDGYRNRNLSLRAAQSLGSQTLSASVLATDADIEFDQGETAAENRSGGVTLAGPLSDRWSHQLVLGAAEEMLDTPVFFSRFESERRTLDWQHTLGLGGDDTLGFGVNLLHADGASIDSLAGEPNYARSRTARAAFASWQRHAERLDLEVAARWDHDDAFGGEATAQVGAGWRLDRGWRITGSWGEGFRAPTLNELYSPGFGGLFAGNPDLDPERSHSTELGLEYAPDDARSVTLRAFRTRVRDLIDFSGGETFQAVNINRAAIDGAELGWRERAGDWSWRADFTWQDAEDARRDADLLRRAPRKLALEAERRLGERLRLGLEASWTDARAELGGALPSFALIHLRARWALASDWRLEARLENVGDRDYELARGFAQSGRSLIVGLVYGGQ